MINRYYDIASDFGDSLCLIAILLIINKKTDLNFVEMVEMLNSLKFDGGTLDNMEDLALMINNNDMRVFIKQILPLDRLIEIKREIRNGDK